MTLLQSALIVPVLDAGPIVDDLRRRCDPSATWSAPPHLTVLVPFVPPEAIDEAVESEIATIAGASAPFAFELTRTARFPRTLYLPPDPSGPFRRLTEAFVASWPEHPPYEGRYGTGATPHLTIADGFDSDVLESVERELQPALPIRSEAREIHLYVGANSAPGWTLRRRFPLGGSR